MDIIKPKFSYGDQVYRIKYNKTKGEVEKCSICNGTGQISISTQQIYCRVCDGLGIRRPDVITYSIDNHSPYIITGLRFNEEEDYIEYCLSKIVTDDLSENDCLDEYMKDIPESTLFSKSDEAEIECELRNKRK